MVLKLDVALVLALACAHGVDIRDPAERRLAFLVAAVNVAEVESGRNVLLDIGSVSLTAALRYTRPEVETHVLHVFGLITIALATKYVPRGIVRAVPLVGHDGGGRPQQGADGPRWTERAGLVRVARTGE
jgi:hypothetical protein